MSWWTYVTTTSGTDSPKEMQARTLIDGPNFSRWKAGHVPKVDLVAKFARAYDVPVLAAFVAAGFLTADEAKVRPAAAPDFTKLTNGELLELVRTRMKEAGEEHDRSPSTIEVDPVHAAADRADAVEAAEEAERARRDGDERKEVG